MFCYHQMLFPQLSVQCPQSCALGQEEETLVSIPADDG